MAKLKRADVLQSLMALEAGTVRRLVSEAADNSMENKDWDCILFFLEKQLGQT
jgi:hypothetical protein